MKNWISLPIIILSIVLFSGFGAPPQEDASKKSISEVPVSPHILMPSLRAKNISFPTDAAYVLCAQIVSPYKRNLVLSKIAASYIELGEKDRAMYILNLIPAKADKIKVVTEIINKYLAENKLEQAYQLVGNQKTEGQKNFLLEYIAMFLINSEQLDEAYEVFGHFKADFLRKRLAKKLVVNFSDAGRFESALMVAQDMANPQIKDNLLKIISEKMADDGNYDISYSTIKEISDIAIQMSAYQQLLEYLISDGKLEIANEIAISLNNPEMFNQTALKIANEHAMNKNSTALSRAIESVTGEKYEDNIRIIKAIYLANIGKSDKAILEIKYIKHPEIQVVGYTEVAKVLCSKEQADEAFEILRNIGHSEKYEDSLIQASAALGLSPNKQVYYNRLVLKQLKPEKVQDRAFKAYAVSFAKNNAFEKAVQIVNEIGDRRLKDEALAQISTSKAKNHDYVNIIDYLLLISDKTLKSNKLMEMAHIFSKEAQDHLIYTALYTATNSAKLIEEPYQKAKILLNITDFYLKLKKREKIRDILSLASQTIKYIKDDNSRAHFSEIIIQQYLAADYKIKALYLIKMIDSFFQQAIILAQIPKQSQISIKNNPDEKKILLEIAAESKYYDGKQQKTIQ
ncbi:hypothetical protein ACFLZV_05415 [Candidatus Margulisiibacteriota bacterium]